MLAVQGNLAMTYGHLGRHEESLGMRRYVYSKRLKLSGEEHRETLLQANNYASLLKQLKRFEETKALMRKSIPVARRVIGEGHELTIRMKQTYAIALGLDTGATLDDVNEAVTTLEDTERVARRVFGGAHPFLAELVSGDRLRKIRAALRARETPSGEA